MEAKELNKLLASLKANLSVFGAGTGAVLCVLYQQGGAKGKIAQGKGADLETALSAALTAAGKGPSAASATPTATKEREQFCGAPAARHGRARVIPRASTGYREPIPGPLARR